MYRTVDSRACAKGSRHSHLFSFGKEDSRVFSPSFKNFILVDFIRIFLPSFHLEVVMANKGQKFCKAGHIMAAFDEHQYCYTCRGKGKGFEPCVVGEPCKICEEFSEEQVAQLSRRVYQERKSRRQRSRSLSTHSSSEDSQMDMSSGSRKRPRKYEEYFSSMEARLSTSYDKKLDSQMA